MPLHLDPMQAFPVRQTWAATSRKKDDDKDGFNSKGYFTGQAYQILKDLPAGQLIKKDDLKAQALANPPAGFKNFGKSLQDEALAELVKDGTIASKGGPGGGYYIP